MNDQSPALKAAHLRKRIQALLHEIDQLSPAEYESIANDWKELIRRDFLGEELRNLSPFPDANPNPILRIGLNGDLLYFNQAACALLEGGCQLDQPAPPFFQDLASAVRQGIASQVVAYESQGRSFSLNVVLIPQYRFINIYGQDITPFIQSKAASEELLSENQRQQALLEAITDANPGGIAVLVGRDLIVAHANPAYRFICPHDGNDLVGLPYEKAWSGSDSNSYANEMREVLKTGRPFLTLGFERNYPDGSNRIFTLQARRIYWGDQPGVLVILWDTTELIRVERALRDTQERMRMALANSSITLYTMDCNLRYTWQYNPSRVFGSSQILGKRDDELLPTPEMAEILAWKRQVLESGVNSRREVHYRLGQRTVYLDVNLEPLKDEVGNITGLLGSSMDITERKLAEQEVALSEQRFTTIFTSISDCCYTLDQEWRFTTVNDPALAYFHKTREQLLGQRFWDAFPQVAGTFVEHEYHKAVREQTPAHYEILSPISGRWAEVHAYPSAEGLFVIFRDVTERRQAQEIHQAMNEIQQLLYSTLDADEVMQRAVSAAAKALGSETAALSLRSENKWIVRYVHGFPKAIIGTQMNDEEERHAILAIQTRQPVAISDTSIDERVNREHLRKWGIRSVLVVPVLLRGEAVGVLFFNYTQASFVFQSAHIDFATQLAASISLAMENARLYQDLQKELAERKQVESALRQSEQLYRAIGEAIDFGVWVCTPDGRNIYASESFLQLLGITQQQFSDLSWEELLHPDDSKRAIAAWKECVSSGGNWDIELRFRGADGRYHPILARGVPVRNEQGEINYWAGINLDIGRLRQREAQQEFSK